MNRHAGGHRHLHDTLYRLRQLGIEVVEFQTSEEDS
jgi:hypothetical protein